MHAYIQAEMQSRGINSGVERLHRLLSHNTSNVDISATKRPHPIYMPISQMHSLHINGVTKFRAPPPPKPPPASLYQTSHIPIPQTGPDDLHPAHLIQLTCLGRKQQHLPSALQAPGQNRDISPVFLYASLDLTIA
jgi:hypothetical protein